MPTIKRLRVSLALAIWDKSDRIRDFSNRVGFVERQLIERVYRRLPTPARLIGTVAGYMSGAAFVIDSPCPVCKCSPWCSPDCESENPIKPEHANSAG